MNAEIRRFMVILMVLFLTILAIMDKIVSNDIKQKRIIAEKQDSINNCKIAKIDSLIVELHKTQKELNNK